MKVALIGGAFDPPHNGHILCVTNVLNSGLVDEVWLVPSGDGRYDKAATARAAARKEMLQLVLKNEFAGNPVKLESSQADDPADKCFTSELLQRLKKQHAQHEFYLVVGSDNAKHIANWSDGARLHSEEKFIVVPRILDELAPKLPLNFMLLDNADIVTSQVSSHALRELLAKKKCVSGLLPGYLLQHIKNNALYGGK